MIAVGDIAARACAELHASQRVDELADALGQVAALDADVLVEIGCDAGGALWAWGQVARHVFGITLEDNSAPTGGQCYDLDPHGATVWRGDSHDPASLAWLVEQLDGRPVDVLVIDGDHSYAGVRADFEAFSPLVRAGGLVLVHDVLNPYDPRVDVPRWWAEVSEGRRASVIASRRSRPVGFGVLVMEG